MIKLDELKLKTTSGDTIVLSINEAKQLYKELKKIFEKSPPKQKKDVDGYQTTLKFDKRK